ncbi:ATP phosphoribosyltransferase regulatory subunit [Sediminibacillus massiliensis]|uniref:ATP phosphoribosyltransferase regulatory subunit n=1 Tax=Sediminibacillus massiliensis TaxID=1926277 RepID=UPI0009886EB3|nr:ATP phosphoribosyltransferase regulatory subunit [Sediminibacillus massiliensis]
MFLPAGSQDETGQQIHNRFHAFEKFRTLTWKRNYKSISTPVVEYAGTFTNEYAGMKLQNMLKWFNGEGEIEVLRPDWTTAIARALVNQTRSQLKWCYQGSVFRSDKTGMESRQAGIEIVHCPKFLGESECLLTAVQYLSDLNISDYLIELGHTGIFEELTNPLQLTSQQSEQLRQAMHDKQRDVVYDLAAKHGTEESAEELTALIDAYGSKEVIEKYEGVWKDNDRLLSILDHIKRLVGLLEDSGIEGVLVDLGRVKNLPYYCGTMFRGYLKVNGAICFSGGRYDKLYEQFEKRISAVGLAFDVDVLSEQLPYFEQESKICIVADEETHAYAEKLRNSYQEDIVDILYEVPSTDKYHKIVKVIKNNNEYKVVEE